MHIVYAYDLKDDNIREYKLWTVRIIIIYGSWMQKIEWQTIFLYYLQQRMWLQNVLYY